MPQTRIAQACAAALLAGTASAQTIGPDLYISDTTSVMRWGARDGMTAYSAGTMVCNIGDAIHDWYRNTAQHPVIASNLYRVKDHRFEQIGVSWVKHTFSADTASVCAPCQIPAGYNAQQLGVGCADAYSAAINGELWTLGPRSTINGFTGVFAYPVDYSGIPAATPTIGRRIQVQTAAVDPSKNAGARYFAETQFVAAQEASWGNGENSSTYREFTVGAAPYEWTASAPSRPGVPAIYAWREAEPAVRIEEARIPGEGLLLVASLAIDLGDGRWRYLYAIQNVNSDRAVSGLRAPVSTCALISAQACVLPVYHSGETWSNEAWTTARSATQLSWAAPGAYATAPNTSALRWSSVASFEFTTNRPPRQGFLGVDLFKPGPITSLAVAGVIPGGTADFNGDGFLDFFDYDDFVTAFESGATGSDFNGDGFLDFFDYDDFVTAFEAGC